MSRGLMCPHVVLVTGSLQGGGAERVLSEMANYWARKNWTVTFVTWSGSAVDDFYELDPRVDRGQVAIDAPSNSRAGKLRYYLPRILALRKLLITKQPDAVLSFINVSNILTIIAAFGLKTRVVISERVQPLADPTLSSVWKFLRKILYSYSDEIVAQTEDAAAWIEQHCRKSAIVIPNPLRPLPNLDIDREPLIVAVGRLARQKGFDLLLRAFAQLAADFKDWHVAIIGEGYELDQLLHLRGELGLSDRVQFLGKTADVETWMARAGLVVQPSRFEGFPNVLLESMGMGAAVISTDCPSGPGEIIQDDVNGRLIPANDVGTLAAAMAELMSKPGIRDRLGQEATKVRDTFRREEIMSRWENCLLGTLHL